MCSDLIPQCPLFICPATFHWLLPGVILGNKKLKTCSINKHIMEE